MVTEDRELLDVLLDPIECLLPSLLEFLLQGDVAQNDRHPAGILPLTRDREEDNLKDRSRTLIDVPVGFTRSEGMLDRIPPCRRQFRREEVVQARPDEFIYVFVKSCRHYLV